MSCRNISSGRPWLRVASRSSSIEMPSSGPARRAGGLTVGSMTSDIAAPASAPPLRVVGIHPEAQLADELGCEQPVAGVEAPHADVPEQLLEPVGPERAGAAGEVHRPI